MDFSNFLRPKEAIRAVRKKITNGVGKDWRSISYCLVVCSPGQYLEFDVTFIVTYISFTYSSD